MATGTETLPLILVGGVGVGEAAGSSVGRAVTASVFRGTALREASNAITQTSTKLLNKLGLFRNVSVIGDGSLLREGISL